MGKMDNINLVVILTAIPALIIGLSQKGVLGFLVWYVESTFL